MAYDLGERFSSKAKCCMLLEPAAYHIGEQQTKTNKVHFLAKSPRVTAPGNPLWTHALYDTALSGTIPNCASIKSKCPRFPYESFSKEDLEDLLCRCGIQSECVCPTEEVVKNNEVLCQGKVKRRIFIGTVPKSAANSVGLSVPSKGDQGFKILPDGSKIRQLQKTSDESPPFYDARVNESTAFYHGCKWSKWTSKRSPKQLESCPGPTDYYYVKQPADYEICAEKFREYRRQKCKQLRFIEMIQQQNIIEGRPGPASYSPELPKGNITQSSGPKAERFVQSSIEKRPGPADHNLKREFDPPEPPIVACHAKLPEPSFFGIKAQRFKPKHEVGPSPATYSPSLNIGQFVTCPTAPFGSSSIRFSKSMPIDDSDDEDIDSINPMKDKENSKLPCHSPTWGFKSRTVRMKPLVKKLNEPSPADLPQSLKQKKESRYAQFIAPFFSSEGRFQPWNNWISVLGKLKTPGPCYYSLEKPKCYPAVPRGPLFRSPRFSSSNNENPPPNAYTVSGGIESVLATHNEKLKENIRKQHTFHWDPIVEPRKLSFEEQEAKLLQKSIALLDNLGETNEKSSPSIHSSPRVGENQKMLRCFVYGQNTPHCV